MKQLSKIEIIEETVKFYSEDTRRRSLDDMENCLYNTEDGKHCAVGRCMLPQYKEQGLQLEGNTCSIESLYKANEKTSLDEILQEQYRGYELSFWINLQTLHDRDNFWTKEGLTARGKQFVENLIKNSERIEKEKNDLMNVITDNDLPI